MFASNRDTKLEGPVSPTFSYWTLSRTYAEGMAIQHGRKKIKHENKTHEPSMKCFNVANPSIFVFFYKWRKGWNIWFTIPEQPLLQEYSVLTPHVQYIYTQTPICQSCLSEHYECLSRITNMKSQRWATSVTQPHVWGVSFPVAPRNPWEMKRWIMRYEQTLNSSIYANKFSGDTP